MSAPGGGSEKDRVEELLRVNARLAAEVRALSLGMADAPRGSAMTTARRLGALLDERDTLMAQLVEAREQLEVGRTHRDELERDNAYLAAELLRLRGGFPGLLRRLRARLRRA